MGNTWQTILDDFVNAQRKTYESADDQEKGLIEAMAYTLQSILEKLRDAEQSS